jgi:hypothetical protein
MSDAITTTTARGRYRHAFISAVIWDKLRMYILEHCLIVAEFLVHNLDMYIYEGGLGHSVVRSQGRGVTRPLMSKL